MSGRAQAADRTTRPQSSFFALALLRAEAYPHALTELDRLGNMVPEFPWAQLGDPVEKFTRACEIAKANLKQPKHP